MSTSERVTLRVLRQWVAQGQRIPVLTCYDAIHAGLLWRGGVRVLLVGDSAGAVVLGHETTLGVDLPLMLELTAAVRRGAPESFVIGDMPFGSYQASPDEAVSNAIAFIKRGADAVKLEVDASFAPLVQRLSNAGVPVMAHIGWRPQQARYAGVRTALVAGRTPGEVQDLAAQAQRLEHSGAVMLLVEQSTAEVSQEIVKRVSVPVIGCGAGPACHGHVVVLHDWLGLTPRQPSFVKPHLDLADLVTRAAQQWVRTVESGQYLRDDHPYRLNP